MRHVNFLDGKSAARGQTELNYLSILIVFVVISLGCAGFMLWQRHSIDTLKKQLDSVTTEVNKLSASVSSKHKKESAQDILAQLNHPIAWSRLLKEVALMVPPSIQLSQLTGSLSGTRVLVLKGNMQTAQSIFSLKHSLMNLPECKNASVANLAQSTFQIECQLR